MDSLNPTRDLVFINDTVNRFIEIANSDKTIGEEINIATQTEISIGDLCQTIIQKVDPDATIVFDNILKRPEKSEVERLLGCNKKLKQLTSWK